MDIELLKYPIGKFVDQSIYKEENVLANIQEISALPSKVINLVGGWNEAQLDTAYRPDGWTVRQVIHHLADSHMNAYMRTRLAITEANSTIKAYNEKAWASLPDASAAPIDLSTQLLRYVHMRWVLLLHSLSETELERTYYHPGYDRTESIRRQIASYAWHGEHHYQQIRGLAIRNQWI